MRLLALHRQQYSRLEMNSSKRINMKTLILKIILISTGSASGNYWQFPASTIEDFCRLVKNNFSLLQSEGLFLQMGIEGDPNNSTLLDKVTIVDEGNNIISNSQFTPPASSLLPPRRSSIS